MHAECNSKWEEDHNEIFGTWMVTKKNTRNKYSQTNQAKGTQRRKLGQFVNSREESDLQIRAEANGWRFTILDMDEEHIGINNTMEDQNQIVEESSRNTIVNL